MLKAKIAPYLCSKEEILQAIHTTYERGDRAASELLAKLGIEGANKEEETIEVFDLLDGERRGGADHQTSKPHFDGSY